MFQPGETSTTIEVPINDDLLVEGAEQFFGRIIPGSDPPANLEIFAPNATVTIVDNDCKYSPQVIA